MDIQRRRGLGQGKSAGIADSPSADPPPLRFGAASCGLRIGLTGFDGGLTRIADWLAAGMSEEEGNRHWLRVWPGKPQYMAMGLEPWLKHND
jgi:hypothetical protein